MKHSSARRSAHIHEPPTLTIDLPSRFQYLRRSLRKTGSGAPQRKLLAIPAHEMAVCSVVAAELLEGCYRSQQVTKNLQETRTLFGLFRSLPFDDAAAEHAATVGAALIQIGERIDQNDLFIAAIALANNLVLVTHNTSHFNRIAGLKTEDWQATP